MKKQAIMIFGPTASGKTRLGIEIAQHYNGVIINADSRQLYKEMDIISAMPSPEEFAAADHRLFRFLEPSQRYSAGQYLEEATCVAKAVWQEGKLPIFLGGTGLYLKMLTDGISKMPDVSCEIEEEIEAQIKAEGVEAVHGMLKEIDPATAERLHATDTQRITRALGVYKETGKTLTYWQSQPKEGALSCDFFKIAIAPERKTLHERIEKRLHLMMEEGVEGEIRSLYDQGLSATLPALKGLGIPEFYQYFDGDIPQEKAVESTLFSTRQYAKRQMTWVNNSYHPDLVLENAADFKASALIDFIK